jgi:sugar lactone lactonase YvrE
MRAVAILAGVAAIALAAVRIFFGDGERLEDRTVAPTIPSSVIETVANLDYPPGNIAVAKDGRVFFTLHPDGRPPVKVVELVDGRPVPYPSEAFQRPGADVPYFQSILAIRIDQQDRLWTLDFADFGRGQPRISAFNLASGELVHTYDFPRDVAGLGSMLNDFQVSPDGNMIYIAETSPIIHRPAIVVYDVRAKKSRRVLHRHASVLPEGYIIQAPGRDMRVFGLVNMRIGVDSIGLDEQGEWLYYGPVSGDTLYRVRTVDLDDEELTPEQLASRVEAYAPKTLSDGITVDSAGNVYLSDMEHSAVVLVRATDRKLETLVKDERLRWPDGFSFGPGGWLYVTCSSLQHVLFLPSGSVREHAPYQIFRFKPGHQGVPGR